MCGAEDELMNYFYNSLLNIKQPIINIWSVYWLFYNHVYCIDNISNSPLTCPLSAFIGLHFGSCPILNLYQSCSSVCFWLPEEPFVLETKRDFNFKPKCSCVLWERERPKTKDPSEPDPSLNNAEFMPVTMCHLCQSQWLRQSILNTT